MNYELSKLWLHCDGTQCAAMPPSLARTSNPKKFNTKIRRAEKFIFAHRVPSDRSWDERIKHTKITLFISNKFLCLPNKCFCLRSLLLFSASIECMWVSIWRALCFDLITQKRTQSRRTNLNFMHPSLFLLASPNYILNKYRNRNQTFVVRFRILGSKRHFSCVCAQRWILGDQFSDTRLKGCFIELR